MKPSKQLSPLVIGLTGPIGAGKSEAARYLCGRFDVEVIDADRLGHEVLLEEKVKSALKDTFGDSIFDENGEVVRAELAKQAFADTQKTEALNRITRPAITELARERISGTGAGVVVLEAAELCKSELHSLCHTVWAVIAPEKARLKRLTRNRAMKEEDAKARMDKQWSEQEYQAAADVVLDSSRTLCHLKKQAKKALQKEWQQWVTGTAEA